MPGLRSVKNWSRHLRITTQIAGPRRALRKAERESKGLSDDQYEKLSATILEKLAQQEANGKFKPTKLKIAKKIIASTALRNVGAKKVLSAKQYTALFRQLLLMQSVIWQQAKMEEAAMEKYGLRLPREVQEKIDEYGRKNIYPHVDKVFEICGNKKAFVIKLLKEMENLTLIAHETDF